MRGIAPLLSAVVLFVPVPADAQSNAEINAGVQFNFRPPGARSLAMGGAFVAVADDATAAYTNPAGLGVLTKPELSLEIRNTEFTTLFTDRGNSRTPSGIGIDTVEGLINGRSTVGSTGPAFASVVLPAGRFAVALYLHELSRFRAALLTQGPYFGASRAFPAESEMSLDIVNYGLATSFRASEKLWLGAGISLYTFEIDSMTDRFGIRREDFVFNDARIGGFYGPPDYGLANIANSQTQEGDDTAVDVTAGLLWRPSAKLQVGAVFRRGPEFEGVSVEIRPGARFSFTPSRAVSGFKVPDAFALGLALRPSDQLVLAAEVVRVRYSQRLKYFVDAFGGFGEADPDDYAIDDGTELHLGAEYVVAGMARPLVFRAGAWREPDNRIRWVGPPLDDDASEIFFRKGEANVHGAFGLGWVASSRFQLDAGADLSDRGNTWTASAVLRF